MKSSRSLLPREHGAYAELAFPLISGLALAPPTLATWAVAAAACALFLVHEPVAILSGLRGARLQGEEAGRAWTRTVLLSVVGLAAGAVGVSAAGGVLWPDLAFPLLPLLPLVPLVVLGKQKSLAGEILVITVFAALVFPLGATSGAATGTVLGAASVWWGSYFLGTLEVHAIKAVHKGAKRSRWTRWGSPFAAVVTLLLCGAALIGGEANVKGPALALVPPGLVVLTLSTRRVHPRYLKRIGWTLVVTNTLSLIILLAFG